MRYQDDIYNEHNMKRGCRAAVAQWKKLLSPDSEMDEREFNSPKFNITIKNQFT